MIYKHSKILAVLGLQPQSGMPPGAEPLVTGEMDEWLKPTVLNKTLVDFGYDRTLWTCAILAELLKDQFGVTVSESAVRLHLKALGLTPYFGMNIHV